MNEAVARATDITVRVANDGDVDDLARLYSAASAELAAMRGGAVLLGLGGRDGSIARSFSTQLGDPAQTVLLAFIPVPPPVTGAGEAARGPDVEADLKLDLQLDPQLGLAGYGTCVTRELAGGERLGSIEELYVKPEARRQGVGHALVASLTQRCRAAGCTSLDAKALPGSRAVKSFFESEGLTARLLVMHRRLA